MTWGAPQSDDPRLCCETRSGLNHTISLQIILHGVASNADMGRFLSPLQSTAMPTLGNQWLTPNATSEGDLNREIAGHKEAQDSQDGQRNQPEIDHSHHRSSTYVFDERMGAKLDVLSIRLMRTSPLCCVNRALMCATGRASVSCRWRTLAEPVAHNPSICH